MKDTVMLEKVLHMGKSTIAIAIGLVVVAGCSREQDEVCPDSEAKVGLQSSESVEPAELHEGRYSVYTYEFKGKGPAHKVPDTQKDELENRRICGSDVSARVYIEWPEERSGLTKAALAKVRKSMLWMAFSSEAPASWEGDKKIVYIVPEALGETEETLRERNKKLWAQEGEDRKIDEYGLQPADWARLTGDALSHETGRIPAKEDERTTTQSLELGLAGIKACAQTSYKCKLPEKEDEYELHCCSQWTFVADLQLDWPFGMVAKENAAWYARPVLCVWNDGYSNDGGNGCHDSYCSKVYSLPDGRELGVADYFASNKLAALSAFVTERLYGELLEKGEAAEKSEYPLDLADEDVSMLVTGEGVKWTWAPYTILPGCYGAPAASFTWDELAPYRKPQ